MIVHVSLYELTEKAKQPFVKKELQEMEKCPLIVHNEVHSTLFCPSPPSDHIQFASLVHIAFFETMEDAHNYPASVEHQQLMARTNDCIQRVTTIDYERETDK